ncbi:hypothetical protein Tco_1118255 [Tanacetum coccineum]
MVPRAVLMKSGLVSVNTTRQVNAAHSKTTVNAARPKSHFSKTTHSIFKRPIYKNTSFKNSNFNQRVNTVKDKNVNAARLKAVVNVGKGVINSRCSRHMTGNMSYLTHYEEIDEGYVALGGNPKGGKLTGKGSGLDWLFNIDALTRKMNYEPIVADPKSSQDDGSKPSSDDGNEVDEDSRKDREGINQEKEDNVNNTNNVNAASTNEVNTIGGKTSIELPLDPNMPELEDYSIFKDNEDVGVEADMHNLDTTIQVSHIPTTRIHKNHPLDQVI